MLALWLIGSFVFGVVAIGAYFTGPDLWLHGQSQRSQQGLVVGVAAMLTLVCVIGLAYTAVKQAARSVHEQISKLENPTPAPSPSCLTTPCQIVGG